MRSKASATVALLALAVLTTYADAPQGGGGAPQAGRGAGQRQAPSTAATPANDPKKVIETMQDNLGMLRGMRRSMPRLSCIVSMTFFGSLAGVAAVDGACL